MLAKPLFIVPSTGKPYGQSKATVMMDMSGIQVGIVGLVEEDWLTTLGACNPEDMQYLDFVEEGRRLARQLKVSCRDSRRC